MFEFPIFTKLGGKDAVFERLKDAGLVKTPDAVRMMESRGRISAECQKELMRMAEETGLAYTVNDFDPHEVASQGTAA